MSTLALPQYKVDDYSSNHERLGSVFKLRLKKTRSTQSRAATLRDPTPERLTFFRYMIKFTQKYTPE